MAKKESYREMFTLVAFIFLGLILVNNMCKVREGHNVVNENGEVLYTQTISLEEVQRAAAESAEMAQNAANDAATQASQVENTVTDIVPPPPAPPAPPAPSVQPAPPAPPGLPAPPAILPQ